jgi:hypothetical protein
MQFKLDFHDDIRRNQYDEYSVSGIDYEKIVYVLLAIMTKPIRAPFGNT